MMLSATTVVETRSARHWNEVINREFGERACSPLDQADFQGAMRIFRAPDGLLLADVSSRAARIDHDARMPRERELVLHYQRCGQSLTIQRGREVILRPGDFTLLDTGHPYRVEFGEMTNISVVRFPQQLLLSRFPAVQGLVMQLIDGRHASVNLFGSFMGCFWQRAADQALADVDDELTEALFALFEWACRPAANELCGVRSQDAQWQAITRFIDRHIADPQLNGAMLAAEIGRSVRYLQTLLATRGETVTQYIQTRRLALAARLLAGAAPITTPITTICFDCGFRDLSHFTRLFRLRYGLPPAKYRTARMS